MVFSMKKLGDYLVENDVCDKSSLDNALQEQAELKSRGIFKPLGPLLTDSLTISLEDLDRILSKMHIDILSMSALSQLKKSCYMRIIKYSRKTVPYSSREKKPTLSSWLFPAKLRFTERQMRMRKLL
jgi:hypothetical protein